MVFAYEIEAFGEMRAAVAAVFSSALVAEFGGKLLLYSPQTGRWKLAFQTPEDLDLWLLAFSDVLAKRLAAVGWVADWLAIYAEMTAAAPA